MFVSSPSPSNFSFHFLIFSSHIPFFLHFHAIVSKMVLSYLLIYLNPIKHEIKFSPKTCVLENPHVCVCMARWWQFMSGNDNEIRLKCINWESQVRVAMSCRATAKGCKVTHSYRIWEVLFFFTPSYSSGSL